MGRKSTKNFVRMDSVTALFYVAKLKQRRKMKVEVVKGLMKAAKDCLNNKKTLAKNIKKFSADPKVAQGFRQLFEKIGEIKVQLDTNREQVEAEIKSIDSTSAAVVRLEKKFRTASDELARLKANEGDLQNRLFKLPPGEGPHQKKRAKIYTQLEGLKTRIISHSSLVKTSVCELKKLVAVMDDMAYGYLRIDDDDDSCSVSVDNCASNRAVLQETSQVVTTCSAKKVESPVECDIVVAHGQSSQLSSVESQTVHDTEIAENQISPISPAENAIHAMGTELHTYAKAISMSQIC